MSAFFFFNVCICACLCLCAMKVWVPREPRRGFQISLSWSYSEQPGTGAGKQTQVPCKSRTLLTAEPPLQSPRVHCVVWQVQTLDTISSNHFTYKKTNRHCWAFCPPWLLPESLCSGQGSWARIRVPANGFGAPHWTYQPPQEKHSLQAIPGNLFPLFIGLLYFVSKV